MKGKEEKGMRAVRELLREENEFISVITRSEATKIYFHEIIYILSAARKVYICTDSGEYSMYRKMDEIAVLLPEHFYRCHKSCIINLEKVKNMRAQVIRFECGKTLALGAGNFAKTIQAYRGYLICHEKSAREAEKTEKKYFLP